MRNAVVFTEPINFRMVGYLETVPATNALAYLT